jgi:hypothetical protein
MSDLAVFVDQWLQPAGRVDQEAVATSMEAELARLLDEGTIRLPAERVVEIDRLRIDGALVPVDRMGDSAAIGVALARAIASGLRGGGG